MAFPAVQTADTKNGTVTSNSTSWTITYPTNLASGDLILLLASTDGNGPGAGTITLPAGWRSIGNNDGANVSLITAVKASDGTETGTFSLGIAASEQGGWRAFRITGWVGGTFTAGSSANSNGFEESGFSCFNTAVGSPSNAPNPPSLNPSGWDVEDTLWIARCAVDTSRTISVYPLPNLNTADVSGGAGGATLGVCMNNLAQASLDPGTFTISTSDDWVAEVIAIRPAAVSDPSPHRRQHQNPNFAAMQRAGVW